MHDPLHNTVFDIPNESASYRELPEELKARLEASYLDGKTVEELKLDSDRQTARSESLRSQHLEAVKERAAREAQRVEEAAARKRRAAEAEKRKLLEKHEAQMKKHEALMAEKDERREADKARRAAMVEAVEANRYAMEVEVLSMGVKKAEREKSALSRRDEQVEQVVQRNQERVSHAMQVAAEQKILKTERGGADASGGVGAGVGADASDGISPWGDDEAPPPPSAPTEQPTAATPRPSESSASSFRRGDGGELSGASSSSSSLMALPSVAGPPPAAAAALAIEEMRGESMPKHRPHQMPTPRAAESPRRPEMPTSACTRSSPLLHPLGPPCTPCTRAVPVLRGRGAADGFACV